MSDNVTHRQPSEPPYACRHEKMRLVILCAAFLLLMACLVFFLFTKIFLPLFVALVLIYLLYKRIDAYLDKVE